MKRTIKMTIQTRLNTLSHAEKQPNDSVAVFTKNPQNPEIFTKPFEAKSNEIKSQITKRYVSGKDLFYTLPASNSVDVKKALFPKPIETKWVDEGGGPKLKGCFSFNSFRFG
jgi:hypothetical protein